MSKYKHCQGTDHCLCTPADDIISNIKIFSKTIEDWLESHNSPARIFRSGNALASGGVIVYKDITIADINDHEDCIPSVDFPSLPEDDKSIRWGEGLTRLNASDPDFFKEIDRRIKLFVEEYDKQCPNAEWLAEYWDENGKQIF